MIWQGLKRIAAVLFGFALAIITGVLTLFVLGSRWAASEIAAHAGKDDVPPGILEILGMAAFATQAAPVLTLLPALLAVITGEVIKIRSLLYYIAAGGAAGALMPLTAGPFLPSHSPAPSVHYISIMATSGFAAGLVYWLIAGRKA